MVKFVEFTNAVTKEPVWINPESVKAVIKSRQSIPGTLVIYDGANEGAILVVGEPKFVAQALEQGVG